MTKSSILAREKRIALRSARVLASHIADPPGPLDREGFVATDVLIDDGRIAAIAPAGAGQFGDAPSWTLAGRIVLPTFIDAHTHLDKAHIWRRARNPTGDFTAALAAVDKDRVANWTAKDVAARMEFCLRSAYAHGTAAIRTQSS